MRWISPVSNCLLAVAIIALAPDTAAAKDLSIDTLVGRWCGADVDYTFSKTELKVNPHKRGTRLTHGSVLKIENVETGNGWINVKWKGTGNTVYWKFSDDGREMFQHANESGDRGPEMKFHRC